MQDWKIKHKNVTGHPLSAGLRRRPSSAAFCQLKGHVSSEGPAAAMEIDASLLQVRGCGTVCQLIRDKLTLTLNSLNRS